MAQRVLPPLRLLTVFEAVLRSGGIQRAAVDLNVTQPAVSQSLKLLEDHVGTRLFDRTTRPVTLTEAGRILRDGVSQGLERITQAVEEVKALCAVQGSSVTIACSVGTATYWLMPRLAEFYAEHPSIAVNVSTTIGSPAFQPGVDLNIRYGRGEWRDGQAVRLFDEQVRPVCSPILAERVRETGGLAQAVLLHVVSEDRTWLSWNEYFERRGLLENRTLGRYFTNFVQATQAALSGQGVMLGWESNTGDFVREGRLCAIDEPLQTEESFYLVEPLNRQLTRASAVLRHWLLGLPKTAARGTN